MAKLNGETNALRRVGFGFEVNKEEERKKNHVIYF